jgi:tryptophanyl-tRNA synthetase
VDLHTLTVRNDPALLRENIFSAYAVTMACGVDPQKNTLFVQSHVPAHAELAWVMNCFTPFGELTRMTQFKDKSEKNADNVNAGLFCYPTLMAADILLYQSDVIPVGVDQTQHIELARNVAERMNGIYGDLFTVPRGVIRGADAGGKIVSLQDPAKKMSKSDTNPKATVYLLDSEDVIIKKFKSAVTDSGAGIYRAPEEKEGISNLMTIYSVFAQKTDEEIVREFDGRGYGDFKVAVGEVVADALSPVKAEFDRLMADRPFLISCADQGVQAAMRFSARTLEKVYKKIGLGI